MKDVKANNDTIIAMLQNLHSAIGKHIFEVESLTLNKRLKDEIKFSLYNSAEIVAEVVENLEDANTIRIWETI